MNILFVCRYNRFRSRIAEALFNHYNIRSNVQVRSAGISPDYDGMYILPQAARALDSLRIKYVDKKADMVNDSLLKWADKIFIVADNVPLELFPKEKVSQIDVPDAWSTEEETMLTLRQIEKYIKKLAKDLA